VKPIQFIYSNRMLQPSGARYSKNVAGVDTLPIWTDGEQCVSCWKMSLRERLSALLFGRAWLAILSGESQSPVNIQVAINYLGRG